MAKNKNKNKKPVPAPIRNPELKEALKVLKEERTRENEAAMFAEVKKAKLLAPVLFNVNVDAKNGRINLPENTQIKFVLVNSNTGKSFFPVFTDLDEAKKLPLAPNQHPQYVVRSLKDYERMIDDPNNKAEGIAINPMSDNIILPNPLVKRLNSDEPIIAPQAAPAPAAIRYTEPAIYPTAVVNAVYETARTMEDIDRVWMKGKLTGTEMSFVFFVAADKKDEDILAALKIAAEPLSKGIPVECTFVDDRIMETVIKDSVALYDREMEF
ncbi:MAG: SseB family protein [Solobacterium sp.]|nr:SseB family protein [Solobacterium sp.]MBQ1447650.1 SseB family protein [Solobacterium sp.]MBR2727981.1 SseB family protein [Solobacterium sp.]